MDTEKKKILVVDDSALMRRVLCDIINSDKRFYVAAKAENGLDALVLLSKEAYDAVVLDINMPKMNGLQLLAELKKFKIKANVLIASTDSSEGASVTLEALELGALDFIQKPGSTFDCRGEVFTQRFLNLLDAVCSVGKTRSLSKPLEIPKTVAKPAFAAAHLKYGKKIVAIASSTGGPKALQSVIPLLPENLDAPVVLVQHMPKGFTASLADRLNSISKVKVKEAQEGDILQKGVVYISAGGQHMNIMKSHGGNHVIHYTDQPSREGVRPSANYMYESLIAADYEAIVCCVLTGMGADGTEGIRNLESGKDIYVITQDRESCVVYGMPKSVTAAGLSNEEIPLDKIAGRIVDLIGMVK